ncbi:hypothetical protein M1585_02850 [Candidatus Parvarchaeota archaeon]|nr:hypothetical protein [Candidatus Parvarchaeota archaeon]
MTKIPKGYEYTWYRNIKCKLCDKSIPIFSLGHYKNVAAGTDEFSKILMNFYLYGNDKFTLYLLNRLCASYKEWFEPDKFMFDYICVIPSHTKNKVNVHLEQLAKSFGNAIGVEYKLLLVRNRDVLKQHEINTVQTRLENVKDSISVNYDINGKSILVLDNITTTGVTIMVAHEALKVAGAKEVIFFTLGLSSRFGIYKDFDLNPNINFKARGVIERFHSNKLTKEERDKHRL